MRARGAAIVGALMVSATIQCVSADTRQNPYGPIVQRNPFGLKDPPPPQLDAPKEETKPPPNVKLTGISNLFQKRALLEVTEQGASARPGQPPAAGTVNRPILAENEAAFGVEVLSINVEKNIVKIRNNGTESELTFEAQKPSGTPGTPGMPTVLPQVGAVSAAGAQPTVVASPNTQTTGGGGVTIYGGGTTTGAQNNSGVTSYGGVSAIPSPLGAESGLRTIPSRTIRTPGSTDQQAVDAAQQAILMRQQQLRSGRTMPPMPPTPGNPQPQNGTGTTPQPQPYQ